MKPFNRKHCPVRIKSFLDLPSELKLIQTKPNKTKFMNFFPVGSLESEVKFIQRLEAKKRQPKGIKKKKKNALFFSSLFRFLANQTRSRGNLTKIN